MQSSYTNCIDFGDIISTLTFLKNPKLIVECGILEGFSLSKLIENSSEKTIIDAYDIFDKFDGKHAVKDNIFAKFGKHKNVSIKEEDFYKVFQNYKDNSIDLLHIDIANNGDVYQFVFQNYIQKMAKDGIIILEGGSEERDNIEWMLKYNKPKMNPIINQYNKLYKIKTIGKIPSLTIVLMG